MSKKVANIVAGISVLIAGLVLVMMEWVLVETGAPLILVITAPFLILGVAFAMTWVCIYTPNDTSSDDGTGAPPGQSSPPFKPLRLRTPPDQDHHNHPSSSRVTDPGPLYRRDHSTPRSPGARRGQAPLQVDRDGFSRRRRGPRGPPRA